MDYYGIGFSNIRLPNEEKSYIYKYKTGVNQFPEEVFLHEFLHTLERNAKEYGYERPELHDYEKYGYKNETVPLVICDIPYMRRPDIRPKSGNTALFTPGRAPGTRREHAPGL